MSQLRRLNASGEERFSNHLRELRSGNELAFPVEIISSDEFSEPIVGGGSIETRQFRSRFEFAEYLNAEFPKMKLHGINTDHGMWAWLAALFFEQLCKRDRRGRCRPGEHARWIPVNSYSKYYRHLVAGPYRVFRAYRDTPQLCYALLANPLHTPGELYEQLVSSQRIVTNRPIVEAASILYFDKDRGCLRTGAGVSGPGGPRRLVAVANQLSLTWDVHSSTAEDFISLLPGEFKYPLGPPNASDSQAGSAARNDGPRPQ